MTTDISPGNASVLLVESQEFVLRYLEVGEPVPQSWVDYRNTLRAIIADPNFQQTIPTQPAFP